MSVVVARRRNSINPIPWKRRNVITRGCPFQRAETRSAYSTRCTAAVVAYHLGTSRDMQHGPRDSPAPSMRTVTTSGSILEMPATITVNCWHVAQVSLPLRMSNGVFAFTSTPSSPYSMIPCFYLPAWHCPSKTSSPAPDRHPLRAMNLIISRHYGTDETSRFQCQDTLKCPVIQRVQSA